MQETAITAEADAVERSKGGRKQPTDRADVESWIESALGYVPSVARRYIGCGLPFDELLAAGNVGLVEAGLRFDPARRVKFVTYADWWIRKTILKAIQEQSGAVRLPRYRLERIRMLQDLRAGIRQSTGADPSEEDVARAAGLAVDEVRRLLSGENAAVSLDQPVSSASNRCLGDTLSGTRPADDPEAVILRDYVDHLGRVLEHLSERERQVVALRFGFADDSPRTLREVGRELKLSRERVRQIERQALLRLRKLLTL